MLEASARGRKELLSRALIKDLLNKTNATFVILQETKKVDIDRQFIKSIWSSRNIALASLDAINKPGGSSVFRTIPQHK